jgi:tape measure domain-containing protein
MTLNRDAAFRLKVNVDGANQITAFNRNLKGLETTAQLSKAQLGQMNIQINRMAREAGNTTAGIRQHIAALTTLRDRVDLNSKAYQRLGNEIDQLQGKLKAASGAAAGGGGAGGGALQSILGLGGKLAAITAAAAGFGILAKSVVDTGVSAIESERRLRSLSQGLDSYTQVQFAASAAAQKFGITQTQANQEFAQVYARLRPIGLSLEEITSVYNGFNTAAKLSGTTATEASAAFLQLSQGLGTGVLRGEELNSVFEQTPAVVQAIAKEMGVGVGQIRELAKEGKVTSDIVIAALQSIERDGSAKLEEALKGPEQQFRNLDVAVQDLKLTAADFALPAIIQGVKDLTFFIKELNAIIKIVDWNLVFEAIGQAGPLISGGSLSITPRGGRAKPQKLGPALTPDIIAGVQSRERRDRPRPTRTGGGGGAGKSAAAEIREISQAELDLSRKLNAARVSENQLLEAQTRFELDMLEIGKQKLGQRAKLKAEDEAATRLRMAEMNFAKEAGSAVAQAFLERNKLQEDYKRVVEDLQIKTGAITGEQLKQLEIDREVASILERLPGLTQAQIDKIKGLVTASKEVKDSFKDTFNDSLKQYYDELSNFGGQVGSAVVGAFKGIEDQLTTFVTTGKANFRDLANSIIADITRIAIRQAIIRPIVGALFPDLKKSAMGNVFAQNGIQKFARGGIIDKPTVFPFAKGIGLMGEAGPEAIMPLRRGSDGRLGVEAAGGGGGVNVVVNVDAQGTSVQGDGGRAGDLGRVISEAVKNEIVAQKRPGGLLA